MVNKVIHALSIRLSVFYSWRSISWDTEFVENFFVHGQFLFHFQGVITRTDRSVYVSAESVLAQPDVSAVSEPDQCTFSSAKLFVWKLLSCYIHKYLVCSDIFKIGGVVNFYCWIFHVRIRYRIFSCFFARKIKFCFWLLCVTNGYWRFLAVDNCRIWSHKSNILGIGAI